MPHLVDFEVRWKNFRGFRDTGWITLPPLTVLLGTNNAGKTSFSAPFLLMAQTIESPDATSALISRGNLVDVGHFNDLIYSGARSREVFIGFRFHVHTPEKSLKKVGEYPPGAIELVFQPNPDLPSDIALKKISIFDIFKRRFLTIRRTKAGNYSLLGYSAKGMRPSEIKALRKIRPLNFLFSPTAVMRLLSQARARPDVAVRGQYSVPFSELLTILGVTNAEVIKIFSELSYIGPLRERPRRYYEVPGSWPVSIGARGEHAPYILRARLSNIRPTVERWIARFGLGEKLKIVRHFEDAFSVMLTDRRSRTQRNIADVGFGASQVFPLIVQSVAARQGTLTIAEQPEIHLNPKLQCELADLFVEMAARGRRVLLETHSEHFILRLRALIAKRAISADKVAVYFIEKDGRESTIRKVPIDEMGHIADKDWPNEFFAESLKESLALAEAQVRAKGPNARLRRR